MFEKFNENIYFILQNRYIYEHDEVCVSANKKRGNMRIKARL